jgi:transcription elongation factor GreA
MLRIDFSRGHQELSLEIAGRSLLKLDPADLRVRLAFDRAGLAQQAAEQPASLVHAALVTLRGEGTLPELKRTLIPNAVSLEAWTDFWRRAQKGMKDDPRFDLSQTVRKIYRIADPAKRPALALPQFDVKEKLARRVDTLEKFLDENAELAGPVKEAHATQIARLYAKEPLTSAPRLATALLLLRLGAISDDDARGAVAAYFAEHDEFPPSVAKDAQARTIALATGMANPTSVYLAGLASRTKPIRDESLSLLAAHLGGGYLEFLLRLLVKSPARTTAIFHLVAQPELVKGWPAWDALLALVRIISAPPRETHEKAALKELSENDALRAGLRDSEPVPETLETLRLELVRWKVSERLLMPILEMLEQVGRAEFAEDVRAARRGAAGAKTRPRTGAAAGAAADAERATASGNEASAVGSGAGVGSAGGSASGAAQRDTHAHLASFAGRILMTRVAYDRLGEDVRQVGLELKTSIPRAIEIARAHGDLRENAEYEAAKDKQRRYAARLTELEEKWNRALILEPSMVAAGIVGPGTEITIEALDDGERATYWILGEGDDIHGEHVISYLAPLGKAFAGRRAGDESTVSAGGRERRYRVLSVEPKLP